MYETNAHLLSLVYLVYYTLAGISLKSDNQLLKTVSFRLTPSIHQLFKSFMYLHLSSFKALLPNLLLYKYMGLRNLSNSSSGYFLCLYLGKHCFLVFFFKCGYIDTYTKLNAEKSQNYE